MNRENPLLSGRPALTDAATLRARARLRIADGPITHGYDADVDAVIGVLQRALATELVCVLRYKRHACTVKGLTAEPIAQEFHRHAEEEMQHADRLAARISELGGAPDFSPDRLAARADAEYDDSPGVHDMIRADLVAERVAVDAYREAVRWIGDTDPTTRRLLEDILAVEESHAVDLADLLARLQPSGT